MIADRENQTQPEHIPHQRTSPITDKRQWNTSDRKHPNRHSNILENVKSNHTNNANTNIRVKIVLCFHTNLGNMINQ